MSEKLTYSIVNKLSVYITAFIVVIDTAVIIPILSLYALELGASKPLIGLIVGIYAPADIIFNFISGYLSDKIGRKRVFLIGMLIDATTMFLYSLCKDPIQLLYVRVLHGCGSGLNMPSLLTISSEVVPRKRVAGGMSILGLIFALSFLIGIKSGGYISHLYGYNILFTSISILLFILAIVGVFALPETYSRRELPKSLGSIVNRFKSELKLLFIPSLLVVYFAVFTRQFARSVMTTLFPLFLAESWNVSIRQVRRLAGDLMSAPMYSYIIFILFAGAIADRKDKRITAFIGLLILSIFLLLIPSFTSEIILYPIMLTRGIGDALLFPSLTGLVALELASERRGKGFGLYSGIETLASALGAPICGLVASVIGTVNAIRIFFILPLLSAFLLLILYLKVRD